MPSTYPKQKVGRQSLYHNFSASSLCSTHSAASWLSLLWNLRDQMMNFACYFSFMLTLFKIQLHTLRKLLTAGNISQLGVPFYNLAKLSLMHNQCFHNKYLSSISSRKANINKNYLFCTHRRSCNNLCFRKGGGFI